MGLCHFTLAFSEKLLKRACQRIRDPMRYFRVSVYDYHRHEMSAAIRDYSSWRTHRQADLRTLLIHYYGYHDYQGYQDFPWLQSIDK